MPKRKNNRLRRKKRFLKKTFLLRFIFKHLVLILFIWGILLISGSLILKAHEESKLSFSKPIPEVSPTSSPPIAVTIPSLSISLPIGETMIENGKWSIYKDGASHLSTSANPGDDGNIIIYAHNTKDRFGNLKNIKVGDKIMLKNTIGKENIYKVYEINTVNPTQIDLLLPTSTEVLTVYTCTGFADSKRFVVRAIPIE